MAVCSMSNVVFDNFFFGRQVFANVYFAMLLPNSPVAHSDDIKQYDVKVDANDAIVSTYSFTETNLSTIRPLCLISCLLYGYVILKYFLYYLEIDRGIRALDFLFDVMHDLWGQLVSEIVLKKLLDQLIYVAIENPEAQRIQSQGPIRVTFPAIPSSNTQLVDGILS